MTTFLLNISLLRYEKQWAKSYLKPFQKLDTRKEICKGFVHELVTLN